MENQDNYSIEEKEAEIIVAVLSLTLWPIGCVIDAVTQVSVISPIMTIAAFAYVGGDRVFHDFSKFTKAYGVAGLTFGVMTYFDRQRIISKISAEEQKIEGTSVRLAQQLASTNLKQWCTVPADKQSFAQKMICALDLSQFGINTK